MSSADLIIKSGDTEPVLAQQIVDPEGNPVPLAGATAQLVAWSMSDPTPLKITGATTITDDAHGVVQYNPASADTTRPGNYLGYWDVTFANGARQKFPTDGYLWIEIQPVAGSEPQQLISLGDLKVEMNIRASDRNVDLKLIRLLEAARPMIENITGPIIPQVFEEWHDGGATHITLRRRPRTGYGTSPVLTLIACSEYVGPIEWPLAIVASPDLGQTYSCMLNVRLGRVTRRTAGGGEQAFAAGHDSVHVVYQAGQQAIPANVVEATLEAVRSNYMTTQPVGSGYATVADQEDTMRPMSFFMPRRSLELLSPLRRFPSFA